MHFLYTFGHVNIFTLQSCTSPISIAAASSAQSNAANYSIEITYKGEDAEYSLTLPKSLQSHSSPFYENTITSSTSGQFNHVDSIFTSFTEGVDIGWYIIGKNKYYIYLTFRHLHIMNFDCI